MIEFDPHREVLSGPAGELPVAADDQVTRKLAMLLEGHCNGLGATAAARKYGYSKQRYYQLLKAYRQGGGAALESAKRGPKTNYRRTPQLVQLVVRQRFLDPDASAAVISQKLTQAGWKISKRSVERVVAEFGLQKKLHAFRPLAEPQQVGTQRTALVRRSEPADPLSVERGVRELLAQKVSGTMVGVWLLLAEHLRLGTWDLLCGFSAASRRASNLAWRCKWSTKPPSESAASGAAGRFPRRVLSWPTDCLLWRAIRPSTSCSSR